MRMGMRSPKDTQRPRPGPALSSDLFAWIQGETPVALLRLHPDIAAGPDRLNADGSILGLRSEQQSTAFLRGDGSQIRAENGEATAMEANQGWRDRGRIDTLCRHCSVLLPQ